MTVRELTNLLAANGVDGSAEPDAPVTCGYACDLLSWVLAHGQKGMAWCTVQTHVNVVAIAVLMEMACVIFVEGNQPEETAVAKAREEGIALLTTDKTAYEVCGLMMGHGVHPPRE